MELYSLELDSAFAHAQNRESKTITVILPDFFFMLPMVHSVFPLCFTQISGIPNELERNFLKKKHLLTIYITNVLLKLRVEACPISCSGQVM